MSKLVYLFTILLLPLISNAADCDKRYGGITEPYTEYELCGEYAVGYDADLKSPLWVAYDVTAQNLIKAVRRGHGFRSDRRLSRKDRVYSSWYVRSGYDRGHLAPANKFRYSSSAEKYSFMMTNVVPQLPRVNRGIWRSLENRVSKSVSRKGAVLVFTGPIYDGAANMIGKKLRVPSAFYKIIIRDFPLNAVAFIIPNDNPPRGYKLRNYLATIDEVEARTGIDFLSTHPIQEQAKLESKIAIKSNWSTILK